MINTRTKRLPITMRIAALVAITLTCGAWFGVRNLMAERAPDSRSVQSAQTGEMSGAPDADAERSRYFVDKIQPFLRAYCVSCHNERKKSGGMSLDQFTDLAAAMSDRKIWAAAAEVVRNTEMPPSGKPTPTASERTLFLDWIESSLAYVNCGEGIDPGRPTIRRLNKSEYRNTIRDLVGVDFQPAEDFPSDDIGYGFDNIGDVLTLSPILFERYLAAAEKILDQAIVIDKPVVAEKNIFHAEALRSSFGRSPLPTENCSVLSENGKVFIAFECLHAGDYVIRARAYGKSLGDLLPQMTLKIDDRAIQSFEVDVQENKPKTYETRTRIAGGRREVAITFLNHVKGDQASESMKRDRSLIVESIEIEGPFNPAPNDLPDSHKRIMIARPSGFESRDSAANTIIENFTSRAYRRPAQKSEVDRLMKFYHASVSQGEPFERAIQMALRPVLVSPHFLFRIEKDPDPSNPRAVHRVSDYELASRLSYFLWSSMPDEELRALAGNGDLRKPAVLEQQVKRMLAHPNSRSLTNNFASQWLNLRMIASIDPDGLTYPDFDPVLKSAMVTETEMFFEHIARQDLSVLEFIDSDWTFVNKRLATHYGMGSIEGSEFRKVKINDPNRGGVLTQASILMLTSNPTRTSPVKRGKWVLENILGTPPPPPPPNVPELEDRPGIVKGSLRQRMQQHRTNSLCASCHQKLDPLGFGLENFDGIGAWRTMDGKYPIDASGVLPGGEKFNGPAELRRMLLSKADLFRRNIAEKMLTFALGRGLEYYDKCAVDEIAKHLTDNHDRFSALVVAIVKSDPFQKRRGGARE